MKTAPGTVDGAGANVILGADNPAADYRNSSGYVLSGPEYLTVFNGLTGAAMATTSYLPPRGTVSSWGDSYGNRVDRFLAAVAYLDGQRPSLVMARGYYTRAVVVAWDWRNGQLSRRWTFDTNNTGNSGYRGQGAHSVSVADVDADGKDEILYGAAAIDDNGAGLYTTGLGHGDATHLTDMDPARPGLEVFMIHESPGSYVKNGVSYGGDLRDARTGQLLRNIDGHDADVGRGVAFDVDPRYPGFEMWTSADPNMYNVGGQVTSTARPGSYNFGVWWDADPLRELLNDEMIDKWNWTTNSLNRLLTAYQTGASSNNGSKATPALSADLLGDWREEVVWRNNDSTALQIYTTTIPAATRITTLMHDPQYRVAVAWQNVAYNQPPHPSFYLGDGMATPPTPNVYTATPPAGPSFTYPAEQAALGGGAFNETTNPGFHGTAYVNSPATGGSIEFRNVAGGGGGRATVAFRYALAGTSDRTGRIRVNGVPQDITFPPTGAWNTWSEFVLNVDLNPNATNTIRLESTGQDLPNVDELRVAPAPDTTPPAIVSAEFNFQTAPSTLTFTFTEDVSATLSPGDLAITKAGGGTVTPTAFTYDVTTQTATFTLPQLADGDYTATLTRAGVTDPWSNAMAASAPLTFFSLAGDINRDRTIDFADLVTLAQNYNATNRTYADGDLTGDGQVDFADLVRLAQRYNTTLPAPPVAAQMVTPSTPSVIEPARLDQSVFSTTPIAPRPRATRPIRRA